MNVGIGEIAGLLSAISAATGVLLVRVLGGTFRPVAINTFRSGVAALVFLLFWCLGTRGVGAWEGALPLLAFAVIAGLVIGDTLFFSAIRELGPSRATPIAMSFPLPTAAISVLFLGERISLPLTAGILLGTISIWCVSTSGARDGATSGRAPVRPVGLALAAGASLSWAVSVLALRPALMLVPIDFANLVRAAIAWLVLGAVSLYHPPPAISAAPGPLSIALLVATGLVSVATSYTLTVSVHHAGAAIAAFMSSLTPILVAPLAWLFFADRLSGRLVIGIGLGFIALGLVVLAPR